MYIPNSACVPHTTVHMQWCNHTVIYVPHNSMSVCDQYVSSKVLTVYHCQGVLEWTYSMGPRVVLTQYQTS